MTVSLYLIGGIEEVGLEDGPRRWTWKLTLDIF